MKNNKIIITLSEQIFLEFCKTLEITDIKTNHDIIIATKPRENPEWEEESLIIIHWKSISKTTDFIKEKYILIEKIILANSAKILSNWELQEWDVIVPNTFISNHPQSLLPKEGGNTIFLENTIWEDYDLKKFGLILSWVCADIPLLNKEGLGVVSEEFQADIVSEWIYSYLSFLEKEELLSKVTVILQVWEDNYTNLIAVSDMTL